MFSAMPLMPEKRAIAAELLSSCWRSVLALAVSVQNLAEFSVVMTENVKHPVPDAIVTRFIRDIVAFDGWRVISYDPETIMDAVNIRSKFSLHFLDALLAATMKKHDLYRRFAFKKIPWITVIDPFT
jgi:predicted nucleic acid-binding protein